MRIERVIFLVVLSILPVFGQDCEAYWSYENQTCSRGYNEVYRDEAYWQFYRVCCLPGSEGEKSETNSAPNCRATQCLTSGQDTLCDALDDRYIQGRRLEYEEVMREPCTKGGGRGEGVVGLCCQPNSKEGVMLTTLGAEHNEFPHQARLPGCGGTIYNHRYIITASHCVVEEDGSEVDVRDMKVFLGTNIGEMDKKAKEYVYRVRRVIPHEQYNLLASNEENELSFPKKKLRYYNDIALVELERDIQFSENMKALEIAPPNFDPFLYADNAVIVWWGTTETLAPAIHLQKANFILRRDKRCVKRWTDMREFQDQLLCVGGIVDGEYSWTSGGGDSGGPAICRKEDGHPVLCGVTSFGGDDDKCQKNTNQASCPPSGYAEVSYFRRWIEDHAGRQDPSTLYRPYLYGQKVSMSKFPHQVHITSSNGESCGGTLIQPDIVLTAAQCVTQGGSDIALSNLRVQTKVNNLKGRKGDTFKVVKIRLLEGYEAGAVVRQEKNQPVFMTDDYYHNDLAVIKLDKSTSVKQSKLPRLPSYGDNYSWGAELAYPRNTSRSGQMRSREFKLLNSAECQKRMNRIGGHTGREMKVDDNILCGVEKYSGGSTCDRELGGGLICEGAEGEDVLCGVQVFRLCMLSIPNGFMDMRQQGEWVQDAIDDMM